jgi:alkylation response protein AidB-like acyl-CoA dehydrogenase
MGADYETYSLVSEEIARSCGATALTFNMHASTMLWIGQLADDLDMARSDRQAHEARRARVFKGVLDDGHIYAQPFSEGYQTSTGRLLFHSRARRVAGGFRVTGRKIFTSLADAAHYFGVLALLDDDSETEPDIHYLAIAADTEGVDVAGEWNPLGMRGTVSRDLR